MKLNIKENKKYLYEESQRFMLNTFLFIQTLLIYKLSNKNHLKAIMIKMSFILWRGYNKNFYVL